MGAFFLVALVGMGSGCRRGHRGASGSDRKGAGAFRVMLPSFVPANAVGLGLADGKWVLEVGSRVWSKRGGKTLAQVLRENLHLDWSHPGRVWVVWFPGEKAGPLLFEPVVVLQGARFLGSWDSVLAGRGSHRLLASLAAMDCGASVCLGARSVLKSVAMALRGQGRARSNSDFWTGVVRFLSAHPGGFASVMDLAGRFPAGPSLVRIAWERSGKLRVELAGSGAPKETLRSVRALLDRAAGAAHRHQGLSGSARAAQVLSHARVQAERAAIVVELNQAESLLEYFVAPGRKSTLPVQ